jgi:hypothetical protein
MAAQPRVLAPPSDFVTELEGETFSGPRQTEAADGRLAGQSLLAC